MDTLLIYRYHINDMRNDMNSVKKNYMAAVLFSIVPRLILGYIDTLNCFPINVSILHDHIILNTCTFTLLHMKGIKGQLKRIEKQNKK